MVCGQRFQQYADPGLEAFLRLLIYFERLRQVRGRR